MRGAPAWRRTRLVSDADTTLESLRSRIHTFVRDRDWERFHNPKDLAAAIAIEAAELMELCLWKDLSEIADLVKDRDHRKALEEELADIIILSLSLANRLQIDVADAVTSKL